MGPGGEGWGPGFVSRLIHCHCICVAVCAAQAAAASGWARFGPAGIGKEGGKGYAIAKAVDALRRQIA